MRPSSLAVSIRGFLRSLGELTVVIVMTVSLFLLITLTLTNRFFAQKSPEALPKTIFLEKGLSLQGIAKRLGEEGVLSSPLLFRFGVRALKRGASLQAGEYLFEGGIAPQAVLDKLRSGDVVVRSWTLPEGLESSVIVDLLAKDTALSGQVTLESVPEGTLLPETYHYSRPQTRADLVARMGKARQVLLDRLWATRAPGLPFKTPQEAVILASLVEKETPLAVERPVVAAVFLNRLAVGMPLQCDATVRYGLWREKGMPLSGALTKDDLKLETPYNSYLHKGMPPTPICHPGKASLEAVLHPAHTKALYFVADGKGGHVFSHTYEAHQKHHQTWRRHRKSKDKILNSSSSQASH